MAYTVGQKVNIVSLGDPDSAFPPRVIVRDRSIFQVGSDLTDPDPVDEEDVPTPVSRLKVYYTKLPVPFDHTSKEVEAELPLQFQELLVIDLAKDLIRKTLHMESDAKRVALEILQEEEDALLADFFEHVRRYAGDLVQRFDTQTSVVAP